jgi:hypothetical protein
MIGKKLGENSLYWKIIICIDEKKHEAKYSFL